MASKALLCATLLCCLHLIQTAPIFDGLQARWLITSFSSPGNGTSTPFPRDINTNVHFDDIESLLLGPPSTTTLSAINLDDTPENQPYPFSFSFTTPFASTPSPEPTVLTIIVTKEETMTITVTELATTITEFITVTMSPSSSSPSTNPEIGLGPAKKIWAAPSDMTDLSSFKVSKFTGGEKNIKIVTSIPSEASASADSSSEDGSPARKSDNTGSAMQLLYPENSINPAQKPQGGAEFYASPIDISNARNVTFQYSVYFPEDFDWVLAGKLPGLYGGHDGCSGGNAALDCFSTRLMWRKDGAGELYLYAPKDKQTKDLCSDPTSVCDAAYGLSIGRGSFQWTAGSWTTVQQTVYLNTPGEQDGTFALDVNGERAIYRDDVFYRGDLSKGKDDKPEKTTHAPSRTSTKKDAQPTSSTDDGDIIGPILSQIFGIGGFLRRHATRGEEDDQFDPEEHEDLDHSVAPTPAPTQAIDEIDEILELVTFLRPRPTASNPEPTTTVTTTEDSSFGVESVKETEVKFAGIFFSTFFGGHDAKYATPKDQYAWFKDFALAYNS